MVRHEAERARKMQIMKGWRDQEQAFIWMPTSDTHVSPNLSLKPMVEQDVD